MLFSVQNTPRWLIFLIDMTIVVFSVLLAYGLRFNFSIPPSDFRQMPVATGYIVLIRAGSFAIARSYAGIIRYTSTSDALRVFVTIFCGSILFGLTNIFTYYIVFDRFLIPYSIIIIDMLTTTFGMVMFRMVVKIAYIEFQHPVRSKMNVIIYGAGEEGINAKRVLEQDTGTKYKVIAFLDDNPSRIGKKLEGIDIMGPDRIDTLLESNSIEQCILATQLIEPGKKQELVDKCLAFDVKVLNVPPMIRWINGELSFNQFKKVNIEDLLERAVIKLDNQKISQEITGKVVLVSGAAGSIGGEIVRQVAKFFPGKMILLDQAETPLHYQELEFHENFPGISVEFIIVDICNKTRMESIFSAFRPDIVYHAAAYKHVPAMESNPSEAIITNVLGTKIIADLSIHNGVGKFIMISTDKAVNPTSVMGASKRIAEIYTQSLNQSRQTRFITTRFGNVLGSNGSVIPLFRSQIEKGGPITITHPEITRFFMTIPEACQLVLDAGAIGNGGEIFIFDMGASVKIVDLAKKMIRLSGLTLGKDIQIKYIGLRPGEKLYEELLNKEENTIPTHHPLILTAKVREYNLDEATGEIESLISMPGKATNLEIVRKMKEIVPEYKSRNSVYEQLDL
jgi:FlaA1/EpsC-like NDP-sugar epimerase